MLGRKKTIFVGSVIMVIGAAIQCSSFSLGQLIASRFITGFGNGNYGSQHMQFPMLTLARYEHFDSTDMAIRDLKIASPWPNGDDRRYTHCVWRHDLILDRSWILIPGTLDYHLAVSHRIPDRTGTHNCHIYSWTAGISTLVSSHCLVTPPPLAAVSARDGIFILSKTDSGSCSNRP